MAGSDLYGIGDKKDGAWPGTGDGTVISILKALLTGIQLAAGSAVIGKVGHDTTGIGHGHKEVASAGTAEAIGASTSIKWVTIQAYLTNTGNVAVGGPGVSASATKGTGTGITLTQGASITIATDNLADIYVDAITTGDGVRYIYGT